MERQGGHSSPFLLYCAMLKKILNILATGWVWITLPLLTVLFTIPIVASAVILSPFDSNRKCAHFFGKLWGRAVFKVNPQWHIRVSGQENIERSQTYVIVSNHMSLADILSLYHLNAQFKWMAKESLFKVPFLGWSMTCMGYIPLKRGNYGSIRVTYEKAKEWLKKGISVVIFPEGTRSPSGTLNAFKNGAFKLALETQTPILPVAIFGNEKLLPKGAMNVGMNVHSFIRALPAIETQGLKSEDFPKLRHQAHDMIRAEIEKISNAHL